MPNDYKKLIALPGVGPKMAHLVMQCVYGVIEGVSVDTHVHRISNRLRWVGKNYLTNKGWKPTATPGETASDLEEWLPKDKWPKINHMLVGFGQTICRPIGPKCYDCSIKSLCKFSDKSKAPGASKKQIPTESLDENEELISNLTKTSKKAKVSKK